VSDPMQSRGFRNKNPGNLNYIPDPKRAFQGQVGLGDEWLPQPSRRFGEYETHELGIRALVAQLTVNQTRHGANTITKQITRWAPASDNNDTAAYIAAVAHRVGIGATAPLDVKRYSHAKPLVQAIINHECGGQPYSEAQIDAGLALFGLTPASERVVSTVAQAAQTGTGRGAGAVAAAVTAAAPAAGVIQAMGSLPQWTGVALVVAVALVAVAYLLVNRRDA
jgi:hypothetical protein